MRFVALACDYDGTIATDGHVGPKCWRALDRWVASGRRVILVTGRELDQLQSVCARLDVFARVVAENGGVVWDPRTGAERVIGEPAPVALVARLMELGVVPVSAGRVIVAAREPYEAVVAEAIQALGLSHQIVLNKGAVMVLPPGVDKAVGLAAALAELGGISMGEVVGVGDAENDRTFLAACGLGVAVANALPAVRASAGLVTRGADGSGVAELVERLLGEES